MNNHPPIDKREATAYDPNPKATPMLHSPSPSRANLNPVRSPFPAIRPGEEVNPNVKTKSFKIGSVSIASDGPKRWRLRYRDPETARDVRRRLSGIGEKEAHAVAMHINRELLESGGYVPGARKPLPSIAEGLAEAIRLRSTRPGTTRTRAGHAERFVRWLAERYPKVNGWDQIRPSVVQEFAIELERKGRAFDSVRLAVAPIKLGWRHMAENFPDRVRPLPRIRITPPAPREIECLEADEVATLLDWLRTNAPDLWPMATLQALCGLRVLEAAALRECDIALGAGTLTVADTGYHKPKNTSSYRTIPLCDEAAAVLRHTMANQTIRPASGELFVNRYGGHWKKDALGLRWRRVLKRAARDTGMTRLSEQTPRRLRSSFATMAGRLGASDRLVGVSMGHSGRSMLAKHYRRIDLAELRTVSSLMNGWRELAGKHESGNIVATSPEGAL